MTTLTQPRPIATGLQNPQQLRPNQASFSPNLYYWMAKHAHFFRAPEGGTLTQVWRLTRQFGDDARGTLYLGYQDSPNPNWFIGQRLIRVLCNGAKAGAYCFALPSAAVEPVPEFWTRYLAVGRCAIDEAHNMSFIGDDHRYSSVGMKRNCNWCGQAQVVTVRPRPSLTPAQRFLRA
jgi:hypothetical protein